MRQLELAIHQLFKNIQQPIVRTAGSATQQINRMMNGLNGRIAIHAGLTANTKI
jgi:hypothetical protein